LLESTLGLDMTFHLASYATFKTFIGETTAGVAGTEVAVRHTVASLENDESPDPWAQLAKSHGIRLDHMRSENVARAASRLQMVGVYSGFDAFCRDVRSEWCRLTGTAWKRSDGDGPFEELSRNAPSGLALGAEKTAVEYYRTCRNAIIHPSEANVSKPDKFFAEHAAKLEDIRREWQAVGNAIAPSRFANLAFCDIKLFARVTLAVAQQIAMAFDPGNDALARSVPVNTWKHIADDGQRRQRAIGYLRTEFGLEYARAQVIAVSITG